MHLHKASRVLSPFTQQEHIRIPTEAVIDCTSIYCSNFPPIMVPRVWKGAGWLNSDHLLKACGKGCEGLTTSLYGRPRHLRTSCRRPSPRAFRTADEDTCMTPRTQGLSQSLPEQASDACSSSEVLCRLTCCGSLGPPGLREAGL